MLKRQMILADFGEFALRSDSLEDVLTEACRLVSEATGTDGAKVLEITDDGSELLLRAGVGWDLGIIGNVRLRVTSLADFAELVELFDEHDVSFVSVTQAFNTRPAWGG